MYFLESGVPKIELSCTDVDFSVKRYCKILFFKFLIVPLSRDSKVLTGALSPGAPVFVFMLLPLPEFVLHRSSGNGVYRRL